MWEGVPLCGKVLPVWEGDPQYGRLCPSVGGRGVCPSVGGFAPVWEDVPQCRRSVGAPQCRKVLRM